MFFSDPQDIERIAKNSGTTIFALPRNVSVNIKNALILTPEKDKKSISLEQVRDLLSLLNSRPSSNQFILINPADALRPEAENALLKHLEEPSPKHHFVLITDDPTKLLPTIRSRAHLYYLRQNAPLDQPPVADEKTLALAKELLVATPRTLPAIAEKIARLKPTPRLKALEIITTTIDLAEKSYFKTKNPAFLKKLPKLFTLHHNLDQNGHVKLHIVADLC